MTNTMKDVIATLEPTLGRRWFGVFVLSILGSLLIIFTMTQSPEDLSLKIVFLIVGLLFIWQAQWNLRVTKYGLYLTKEGLFDAQNSLICPLYNMAEVDRGMFAFKPSNGFLIRLHEAQPKGWAPGLYWRLGRRLGIGGATDPSQNKAMARALELLIMEHALGPENV